MTMLKCVWSIEAHIPRTHFWRPPWGSQKLAFSASYCIFIFIFRRCPYSPYDFVQVFARDLLTGAGFRAKLFNFARASESSREDSLRAAREDSSAREIAARIFFLRAGSVWFRARLFELRATLKESSRDTVWFRATWDLSSRDTVYLRATRDPSSRGLSGISREILRQHFIFPHSTLLIFGFLLLTAHGSIFLCFSDLLEQHSSDLETKLHIVENFYFLVSFFLASTKRVARIWGILLWLITLRFWIIKLTSHVFGLSALYMPS